MTKKVLLVFVVVALAGAGVWFVTARSTPELVSADPDCPPNVPVMAIALSGGLRQDDVAVIHRNGDVERLTKDHASFDPSFSPDGSEIVFTSGREGFHEECCGYSEHRIYVMNSDGSNQRRLIEGEHQDHSPDWSPDGSEIAFVRDGTDLMVVPASGEDPELLHREKVEVSEPAWLPDGKRLSFASGEDGGDRVMVIDRAGGEAETLIEGVGGVDLAWSPDGETAAFNADVGVYTASFEEPSPRLFSRDAYTPAWSPDGRFLAYYSDADHDFRPGLVAQPVNGGESVPLPVNRKNIYSFEVNLEWLDCP